VKVFYREKETIYDKVCDAIKSAEKNCLAIDRIRLTHPEYVEFECILSEKSRHPGMSDFKIPGTLDGLWFMGVIVVDSGWTHEVGDRSGDSSFWGKSNLDSEEEHRKNVLARESLDAACNRQGFSKLEIDEQMIYTGDEEPAIEGTDIEFNELLHIPAKSEKEKIYINEVCVSCNKLYVTAAGRGYDSIFKICPGCRVFPEDFLDDNRQ